MAKEKKMVEAITSMDEDFAQWYTDIVKKAELSDYSSVKGCMIIKPAGYAIWENIRNELDKRFKATRRRERISAYVYSGKSSGKRERSRRRFRTGSSVGDTGRFRAVTGENVCTSDFRDSVLRLFMHMTYILTAICRETTTSGLRLYVGKRQPVRSFVPENSYGRKVIPLMQPLRKHRSVPR